MWICSKTNGLINVNMYYGLTIEENDSKFKITAITKDEGDNYTGKRYASTLCLAEYENSETAFTILEKIADAIKYDDSLISIPVLESELLNKDKSEAKTKTTKIAPKGNTGKVIELWNTLEGKGVKPVTRLSPTSDRHKLLMARIREFGMDNIEKAIENIKRSDYLCKQKWFTFDWFIRPNNFPKVLDGNYNDDNKDKLDSYWNE